MIISDDILLKAVSENDPTLLGEIRPANKVLSKYVAYHKQIEHRMDGSSGGVFGAILETLAHQGFYFSGAKFDDNLHLRHILFNNPEQISSITGYKPVLSDCVDVFPQIKKLLSEGQKVVFGGTSLQCYALQQYVGICDNLVTIDIINTDFVSQELLDRYAENLSEKYGSKVVDIRFYNKEFSDEHSKRITLANGRVYYTKAADEFDYLTQSGRFTKKTTNQKIFGSLQYRIADITIGSYRVENTKDDGLGYAYVSVNTSKAIEIFNNVKKRLVIINENEKISESSISFQNANNVANPNTHLLFSHSLTELAGISYQGKLYKFKKVLAALKRGFEFAQYKPTLCYKFIRLNFFNKNVKTDYKHNGFIYIAPYCAFKFPSKYSIVLHGALSMGVRRIKSSRQETRLRMEYNSKIIVHEGCSLGAGSNVEIYKNATLEIGSLCSNAELNIICGDHITLGSPVNIARNATIRDTSGHLISTPGYKMTKPVTIGNHVWVCTESTIMPGVTIGDGSIVGACSYVNKKIPPFTLVQGSPAVEVSSIKYFRI